MLDPNLKSQLQGYLARLTAPVELVASLVAPGDDMDPDAIAKSAEMRSLLTELSHLSPLIRLREDGDAERRPSFTVGVPGMPARITFAGLPMGHEFTSLVLALLQTGGHPPKVAAETLERIRNLETELTFEAYI
ncbi:MAG: alkyl hydroperoxide reductase subunit F, partial [Gammaproteobacteria bacterium]